MGAFFQGALVLILRSRISCVWVMSLAALLAGCGTTPSYDVILRGGTVYDGSGDPPRRADVALRGDRIAAVGDLAGAAAVEEIDVTGQAVAPGFINMLSWSPEALIVDGSSQSEIRQGVTLQVFGEGWSFGPVNEKIKADMIRRRPPELDYPIVWTTLGEFLEHLEERGVAQNVASFVGATTVRIHVMGHEDREPTAEELEAMRELVRQAMEEGALGVGSALIYAPGPLPTPRS